MRGFDTLNAEERAELWASLALRRLEGVGAVRARTLVAHYGSAFAAVEAHKEWEGLGEEFSPLFSKRFMSNKWREAALEDWKRIKGCPCGIKFLSDPDYPEYLREIPDAPLLLFWQGDYELALQPGIAVVGARKCTNEGLAVAAHITRGLSEAGITVISGMALGIDRVANLCGLEGVGGSVGVLGCGVDVMYPRGNEDLYALMAQKGLLLSEFVPGTAPRPQYFPVRNRIISGLAYGVLVVEAALRSGTLVTARLATEQNRQVFAVPGSSLSQTSQGCQDLIRRGARPVFTAHDIIEDLAPVLGADMQVRLRAFMARKTRADAVKESERYRKLWELPPAILPWSTQPEEAGAETGGEAEQAGLGTGEAGQVKTGRKDKKAAKPGAARSEKPGKPTVTEKTSGPEKASEAEKALGTGKASGRENTGQGAEILSEIPPKGLPQILPEGLSRWADGQKVFALLGADAAHIDELARQSLLPPSSLSAILLQLEVMGLVLRKPGMYYIKK